MENVLWRPVPDFPAYEVSELGAVRRVIGGRGKVIGRILAQQQSTNGYLSVMLYRDGQQRRCTVHRLVARAFDREPEADEEVNHLDGDRTNNTVGNLEWTTSAGNKAHARATSGWIRGEANGAATLTEDQVRAIREALKRGRKQRTLAQQFGVTQSAISDIARGRSWTHVSEELREADGL